MAIVIFHFGSAVFPFNASLLGNFAKRLDVGVSYFFILSGFIMIIAYGRFDKVNAAAYLTNRFARIYPMLILSVLPILVGALFGFGNDNMTDSFLNLSLLQAWFSGKVLSGNGPAWSLSVEAFFYILFPLLFNRFYKKYSFSTITIVTALFWVVSVGVQNYLLLVTDWRSSTIMTDFILYFPLMHLAQFMLGNLAGLFFINKFTHSDTRQYDVFVLILLAVLIVLLLYPLPVNYHNGFLGIVFVPFIITMTLNNGFITKLLKQNIFVFLGEISYGIYILQYPVYKILEIVFKKLNVTDTILTFYGFVVMLIVASAISYVFIEKPLRNRIKAICVG